ncbi:putative RNA-directed DNA polymerase from transposon BS [Merluccius polli]|uniref:RNA-directed DNA polymerase from transposon BS n=1 Tax=Merluccius polli TaxID=89951 RepID=A0AA47MUU9_MERPO|nr:putative RNA-directed DNA polymerase from transposon BS [Merluccius polli]
MGEYTSNSSTITCGVPQGSILGPKLFILYINDICNVSSKLNFVVFADDTNLFCSGENIQQLLEEITKELVKLKKWFDINKLSLNLKKTKYMVFGKQKPLLDTNIEIKIDNILLERVYENMFLGVIIDHKFSWKPHINHIRAKVARSLGVLGKTRHVLNTNSLYTLYFTLITPYLTYCVEVWGNTYRNNLQPINIMQKKAIRMVNNAGYHDHTNRLFLNLNTLKFFDLVDFKTAQIIYKARHNMLPGNIQKRFKDRDGRYDLRGELNLKQPSISTTLKSFCISVRVYCNFLFTCLSKSSLGSLQMVQNAAARLLTRSTRMTHISPILSSLHWLPINFRIQFKVLVLSYRALHGQTPVYISDLLHPYITRGPFHKAGLVKTLSLLTLK